MSDKQAVLKNLKLSDIRKSEVALREVEVEGLDFIQLVDSVKSRGIINAISVREGLDPETGRQIYWLVDGLHRYTASMYAGKETIPCIIVDANAAEAEELQLIANAVKVETKPAQYAAHLMRILGNNPSLTIPTLANKLNRSSTWLNQQLGLRNLEENIQRLVDDGSIVVSNAYALAKLPKEEQLNFVETAASQTPAEFTPTVQVRVKELRDARSQGRTAAPLAYVPAVYLRKTSEVRNAYEDTTPLVKMITAKSPKTTDEVIKLTLAWVQHLDDSSIEAGQAKFDQRLKEKENAKLKRDAERQAKKEAAGREAVALVNAATS